MRVVLLRSGLLVLVAALAAAGTLALQPRTPDPRAAASYASAEDVVAALNARGVRCTPLLAGGKYRGRAVDDCVTDEATLHVTRTGAAAQEPPTGPHVQGPGWRVTSDDVAALRPVQRALGGQLLTAP